jgi:hypothetical protein
MQSCRNWCRLPAKYQGYKERNTQHQRAYGFDRKARRFSQSIEEAERANNRLAMLGGECEAYKDILKYINDRIRKTEKQRSK